MSLSVTGTVTGSLLWTQEPVALRGEALWLVEGPGSVSAAQEHRQELAKRELVVEEGAVFLSFRACQRTTLSPPLGHLRAWPESLSETWLVSASAHLEKLPTGQRLGLRRSGHFIAASSAQSPSLAPTS